MVTQKKLSKERVGIATGWPLLNKIVILMLRVCVSIAWMLYLNEEACTMDESNKSRARELFLQVLQQVGIKAKLISLYSLWSGGPSAAANAGVNNRLFK